ncbi:MAG TPA: hypothetical protein VGI99_07655 [Gemmataceae bacterium]
MAFSKSTAANIDDVRPYLHGVAKYLVDQLWGARGPAWGTPLGDIEDIALAIRQATRGGEAVWQEPREFCRRCRRDFFPSDQEPGH